MTVGNKWFEMRFYEKVISPCDNRIILQYQCWFSVPLLLRHQCCAAQPHNSPLPFMGTAFYRWITSLYPPGFLVNPSQKYLTWGRMETIGLTSKRPDEQAMLDDEAEKSFSATRLSVKNQSSAQMALSLSWDVPAGQALTTPDYVLPHIYRYFMGP